MLTFQTRNTMKEAWKVRLLLLPLIGRNLFSALEGDVLLFRLPF